MNWEALGAIGELIGAIAVVTTLIFLVIQVRHNTLAMEESNRLEKAAAIDRHSDSIGMWRGRLIDDPEVAMIWFSARNDEELSEIEDIRADNLFINFINTQRSNYVRANIVGAEGLAQQAVMSVAVEIASSDSFRYRWDMSRNWTALASEEYVAKVEKSMERIKEQGNVDYPSGTGNWIYRNEVLDANISGE